MDSTWISDFIEFESTEKGLSKNSIDAYSRDLKQLQVFCQSRRYAFEQMDRNKVQEFLAWLRKREISSRTLARKLTAVRQFYLFHFREGRVSHDPTEFLVILVKQKRLPKHLSLREVQLLLKSIPTDTESGVRDRALMEVWYATGCRVTELCTLLAEGVDLDAQVIRVEGKGRTERWIPIHGQAVSWLERYLEIRHRWLQKSGLASSPWVFLSSRVRPLSRQQVWKWVRRYARLAGIQRPVWPHMIRHTVATHVLQGGADLRVVQEILGHKSIATTEIYTHLDPENLKVMQRKFHPRA